MPKHATKPIKLFAANGAKKPAMTYSTHIQIDCLSMFETQWTSYNTNMYTYISR